PRARGCANWRIGDPATQRLSFCPPRVRYRHAAWFAVVPRESLVLQHSDWASATPANWQRAPRPVATLPLRRDRRDGGPSPMLSWLKSGRDRRQVARSLYGSSVTAARAAIFYAEWGVPDTLQGRFEMVAMHVALILRRLSATGERGRRLGRALTEAFVVDMDDSMRELTFGDLAVPREIKRATAALFDRHADSLDALYASS